MLKMLSLRRFHFWIRNCFLNRKNLRKVVLRDRIKIYWSWCIDFEPKFMVINSQLYKIINIDNGLYKLSVTWANEICGVIYKAYTRTSVTAWKSGYSLYHITIYDITDNATYMVWAIPCKSWESYDKIDMRLILYMPVCI